MDTTDTTTDNLKDQLTKDIKASMLAGDAARTEVLRGLKSVIVYAEVAAGNRESGGLDDAAISALFSKESKKRQESADLYQKGGAADKAAKELAEKAYIDAYLPAQLDEAAIATILDAYVTANGPITKQIMGAAIAAVKTSAGGAADGAIVAKLVRDRIDSTAESAA